MVAVCGGFRQGSCFMLPVLVAGSAPILLTDRAWTDMLPSTALCILCLVLPHRIEGGPPARLTCGAPTVQFAARERIPASAGCAPLHSAAVPACLQTNPARLTCGAPTVRCAAYQRLVTMFDVRWGVQLWLEDLRSSPMQDMPHLRDALTIVQAAGQHHLGARSIRQSFQC